MRAVALLFCCLVWWSIPVSAQSMQWDINPTMRELAPMDMPEMGVHDHNAFDWYDDGPDDCCSNQHCRPYPVENFTENPDGSITFRMYDPTYDTWIVIHYDAKDVKPRPATAPPDPYYHPCFSVLIDSEGGVTESDGKPRLSISKYCIFRPDSSS